MEVFTMLELTLSERIANERIEKVAAIQRTVKSLAKNPEAINANLVIQRNMAWSIEQKSLLIESILLGYPIPPIYTLRSEDRQLWILDGKQRIDGTLIRFLHDEWEITGLDDVYGVDINGMKFSELPEEFQELIADQNLTFYQFEKLTTEQRDSLFFRLNNGKSLSSIEHTRSILGSDLLDYINSLIDTPFMKKVAITDKQRDKFTDQELILQCIALITGREKNLSGKSMREFALSLRLNGLTDEQKQTITETFEYLSSGFAEIDDKTAKKTLKKADVVAIVTAAVDATDSPETFANVLTAFIANQKSGSQYKQTSSAGSAKPENVQKRIDMLRGVLQVDKQENMSEAV
jgi:hypothetical protein